MDNHVDKPKALVIEDGISEGRMIKRLFERCGYSVDPYLFNHQKKGETESIAKLYREKSHDVVTMDGLEEKCFEVYDALCRVKKPPRVAIISSDGDILNKAQELGIETHRKPGFIGYFQEAFKLR